MLLIALSISIIICHDPARIELSLLWRIISLQKKGTLKMVEVPIFDKSNIIEE